MTQHNKTSLFKQLIQRRVFQIVGIYLGAIVAMMEFTGMVVERYGVSDYWVDLVLAGMMSFIPAVLILAWRHGAPGKDEWGKAEKVGIPLNGLITIALLASIASQQTSSVPDPSLNINEIEPPAPPFVESENQILPPKRLGIFFFDPDPQLGNNQWFGYGLAYLMAVHLNQQQNITARSYYSDLENSFFWQVKRAGFKTGLNIPQSLAHSLANELFFDFFTRGKIKSSENGFTIFLQIYDTRTNKLVVQFESEASDIFKLSEQASAFIKQQTQLFPSPKSLNSELQVTDLVTANKTAFYKFIDALNKVLFENNYDAAISQLRNVLEQDPSFALAAMHSAQLLVKSGKLDDAAKMLRQALQYNYKLTERTRFSAKAFIYAIEQKQERQIEVYRNWMDFYPNDYQPRNSLGSLMLWNKHDLPQAASLFEESLKLNPSQNNLHSRLAQIYLALGDLKAATEHYQKLFDKVPGNYLPLLELGNIELIKGNLVEAESWYKKAGLLGADKVSPVLALSGLMFRQGQLEEAKDLIEEAQLISQAPRQRGAILDHKINLYSLRGQYQEAFNKLSDYRQVAREYLTPLDSMFATSISRMHLYVFSGNSEIAIAQLEELKPQLDPALADLMEFGYLFLYIAQSNSEEAKKSISKVEKQIERFQMNHLTYLVTTARGWIADIDNQSKVAVQNLTNAIEQLQSSIHGKENQELLWNLYSDIIRIKRINGEADDAERMAKELILKWPFHPDINYQLSEIYFSQNKFSLAKKHLDRALLIWRNADKDFLPAQQALQLQEKLNNAES